uniref:Uncharacterized protein n=1 Tax=Romanomermis culicivorax TaxID=13658 RepID=A0A915IZ96_ROMCU
MDLFLNVLGQETKKTFQERENDLIPHNLRDGVVQIGESRPFPFGSGDLIRQQLMPPQDCTWLFRAPSGRKLTFLLIRESFGYNCSINCICRDFLDVNTGYDLSVNTYR